MALSHSADSVQIDEIMETSWFINLFFIIWG